MSAASELLDDPYAYAAMARVANPFGDGRASRRIVEAMSAGSGFFQHGHTYLGHPVACAAALAVQRIVARDGLLAAVGTRGRSLRRCRSAGYGRIAVRCRPKRPR